MDLDAYRDIAPYRGQDFLEAIQRVKSNPEGITSFLRSVVSVDTEEQRQNLKRKLAQVLSLLDEVTDYDQFQRRITAGLFLQMIVENSISGFSYSGIENLDSSTAYLYMSNHRDIVLDCALIDLALDGGGQMLCEMAIGDNLLKTEFATDLFKLNGGVTVKRSLPMREKYLESLRLSSYL
ncbi:MAG: glycerol acyltransferase, partial [Spirochaetales bacterium]|nr:glycerol acyltransferase [Spirochaetales bacterium]